MGSVVAAANGGLPVLGICNGFQILTEAHLLPGAMIKNDHRRFVCREQRLRIENDDTAWTRDYTRGERITIPLKNQDGQFVADERTLDELEGEGRVVVRYLGVNPNGSRRDIAGITNARGQRRRPDAAPRARGRAGLRARHGRGDAQRRRRAHLLHLRHPAGARDRVTAARPPNRRPSTVLTRFGRGNPVRRVHFAATGRLGADRR